MRKRGENFVLVGAGLRLIKVPPEFYCRREHARGRLTRRMESRALRRDQSVERGQSLAELEGLILQERGNRRSTRDHFRERTKRCVGILASLGLMAKLIGEQRDGECELLGVFRQVLLLEMVDHIAEQIRSGLRVTALDLLEQIDKRRRKIHQFLQLLLGELQRATGIVKGDLGGKVDDERVVLGIVVGKPDWT